MQTDPEPQTVPHVPQFEGSFCALTHTPLHGVSGNLHVVMASGPVSAAPVSPGVPVSPGAPVSVALPSVAVASPVVASVALESLLPESAPVPSTGAP